MSDPNYDVVGIGNAIVDVLGETTDSGLALMGVEKSIMQLVERERAEVLYAAMRAPRQAAGGSVANTMAGLGNLGLRTAFIGRVNDDALGRFYAEELAREGSDFVNPPVVHGPLPTSRSMIFVSPDGERSMNTYLGISSGLSPADVPDAVVSRSAILFLEGYLYDKPDGMAAFEKALGLTHASGGRAGIALSDPFCVDRHRPEFRRLVRHLDYVIGNEHEWCSLYETGLDEALALGAGDCGLVVCTRSGGEVVIVRGSERSIVPVTRIVPVDATGAGDLFAAGFLYGLATGQDMAVAGRMGCVAAAEVIGHYGARPETDLKALFAAAGLI